MTAAPTWTGQSPPPCPWRSLWVTRVESGPRESSQNGVWRLRGSPEALLDIPGATPALRSGRGAGGKEPTKRGQRKDWPQVTQLGSR